MKELHPKIEVSNRESCEHIVEMNEVGLLLEEEIALEQGKRISHQDGHDEAQRLLRRAQGLRHPGQAPAGPRQPSVSCSSLAK